MKTLTIKVPDTINIGQKEAAMILASKLYELGKLSLGQAAELVGSSKQAFIEWLANYGVSFFDYTPEESDKDTRNARNLNI